MEILTALLLFWLPAGPASAQSFLLTPMGDVTVKAPGAARFAPVKNPLQIEAGTEIETGGKGGAELTMPDGSKLVLAPSTDFVVKETEPKETVFGLLKGKLRAAISGLYASKLKIETNTAVAAVRGTEFDISAGPDGSRFDVAEGALEVADKHDKRAMVTSEESMNVGAGGLTPPTFFGLSDPRAQPAARPVAVAKETARVKTRTMLEDLRHQELKTNEAQLGKTVVDVNGYLVRIEEYLLRPAANSLKFLFLSNRDEIGTLNWGYLQQTFHAPLPNDLSTVPDIIAGSFFNPVKPTNWITSEELYLTNTVDAFLQHTNYGDPVQIDFTGLFAYEGNGSINTVLWFPAFINSFNAIQTPGLAGNTLPAVTPAFSPAPGNWYYLEASHLDYGTSLAKNFTFQQFYIDPTFTVSQYASYQFDPSNFSSVDNSLNLGSGCDYLTCYTNSNILPFYDQSYPSGFDVADQRTDITYADGTTLGMEQFLVNNDGSLVDFFDTFPTIGNFNIELEVDSNQFQNGTIDVVIAPELFQSLSSAPKGDVLGLLGD